MLLICNPPPAGRPHDNRFYLDPSVALAGGGAASQVEFR